MCPVPLFIKLIRPIMLTTLPSYSIIAACDICQGHRHPDFKASELPPHHTLTCGHRFHYGCIYEWYRELKRNGFVHPRRCPVCEADGGFLPPHSDFRSLRNITVVVSTPAPTVPGWRYCLAPIKNKASTRFAQPCGQPCHEREFCAQHSYR